MEYRPNIDIDRRLTFVRKCLNSKVKTSLTSKSRKVLRTTNLGSLAACNRSCQDPNIAKICEGKLAFFLIMELDAILMPIQHRFIIFLWAQTFLNPQTHLPIGHFSGDKLWCHVFMNTWCPWATIGTTVGSLLQGVRLSDGMTGNDREWLPLPCRVVVSLTSWKRACTSSQSWPTKLLWAERQQHQNSESHPSQCPRVWVRIGRAQVFHHPSCPRSCSMQLNLRILSSQGYLFAQPPRSLRRSSGNRWRMQFQVRTNSAFDANIRDENQRKNNKK